MCRLRLYALALPDISKSEADFLDSSFFRGEQSPHPQLPTPAALIEQYGYKGGRRLIKIKSFNMAVKIDEAARIRLEEVQTMWAMRGDHGAGGVWLESPRWPGDGIIQGLDRPDMYRDFLADTGIKVYFTHGDLNLCNIMVTGSPGEHSIAAILDWEQAGWYPEYWEDCKMHLGAAGDEEWDMDGWPEKILDVHEDAWFAL